MSDRFAGLGVLFLIMTAGAFVRPAARKLERRLLPAMVPERKRWWLLLEWTGTVLFGALPDTPLINRTLARIFYFFFNRHAFPNLRTPRRFNEKLIALKLSNEARAPLRTHVTDKEFVKEHVADRVGAGHIVPTLAVLRSAKDIDEFEFPLPSVVKPTHSSQEVLHLESAQPTTKERARLKYWMRKSYFDASREPNYRNLEKKLIVEPVLGGHFGAVDDIKVMCFFGKPKLIHVDRNRYGEHRRDYFDAKGDLLPIELRFEASRLPFPNPEKLDQILRISETLSRSFRFIRVDFYIVDGAVLVGELTSYPSNCVHAFRPAEADLAIARALDDPELEITPSLLKGMPPAGPVWETAASPPPANAAATGERPQAHDDSGTKTAA